MENVTDHFGITFRNAMLAFAGASLFASLALRWVGNHDDSHFVGSWVPTLLVIALWTKLVKDEPRLTAP
jgi:hypothetical protein